MNTDGEIIVVNMYTGEIVPFMINKNGEVSITSTNPDNTDLSCIVTIWANYIDILQNLKQKKNKRKMKIE